MQHEGPGEGHGGALHPVPLMDVFTGDG